MPRTAIADDPRGLVAAPPPRLSLPAVNPDAYRAMVAFSTAAEEGLDPVVADLVRIRVSQLNGCGFCLDLHSGAARTAGVDERRLSALAAWRLTPFFDRRERAALALAEAVTLLPTSPDLDHAYDEAAATFGERELGALLWTIAAINAWNRIAVPTRTAPIP